MRKNKKTPPKTTKKRTSQKVLSAASHLKTKTKKLVDDVFLKLVGLKVLERAEEMTQEIRKEGKPQSRGRSKAQRRAKK